MKRILTVAVLAGLLLATDARPQTAEQVRFTHVDVYVDTAGQRLGAYQLEFTAADGQATVVGIEGGEHPAFHNPPYYDPRAMSHDRVILAAYSTGDDLPAGRTCVAHLHLRVEGTREPTYAVKLETAATGDGTVIGATASVYHDEHEGHEEK